MNHLTRDTRLCISLAGRPSNLGTRFHNYLYGELGLDFVYKACTTTDLEGAMLGIRALGIRGCGVSMPFKEDVLDLVDVVDPSAAVIASANTIVNDDGLLTAYNTDYLAVRALLPAVQGPAAVAGSGGMAKAAVAALRDSGFDDVTVVARNPQTGRLLAERYGFGWRSELGELRPALLLNATPVGMDGGAESADLAFSAEAVDAAAAVFEVVAVPEQTPLVRRARKAGKQVILGTAVSALQAAEQFALYTGVRPSDEQIRRASEYSRS
ncbi:shikimate 5-dehydrogenase [Rhodococcus sp. D2-41]|uniref:Shikimate 5-dehydrogenase n=1 Tax=Speluncibacter jeojiensis TaxID=2710754 RepID=A0A9X4LZH6_9ACTN|nr:shikimate 5-dehydrogenase [Rhodococcus sp. D2-41]MDG3010363.1 shikimate 5-dehydrogenase [Rhodococcus sp. D2-41]MDG3014099.1 shikimate 5-dehydrogenase [Corynebacteriales bacterium D3-21]